MQKQQLFLIGNITLNLYTHPKVWSPTSFAHNLAPLLMRYLRPNMHVLEMGLGSGVLSILAAKLGAIKVTALDVNPFSINIASKNWIYNQCNLLSKDFRLSDRWNAMQTSDQHSYDLIWSNPPLLPQLDHIERKKLTRDDYEISGKDGRDVLDAIITGASKYLQATGQLLTIATSLQGWKKTETLLNQHWHHWEIIHHLVLELTEECTEDYITCWQTRKTTYDEKILFYSSGKWWHDVWFIRAWQPRKLVSKCYDC